MTSTIHTRAAASRSVSSGFSGLDPETRAAQRLWTRHSSPVSRLRGGERGSNFQTCDGDVSVRLKKTSAIRLAPAGLAVGKGLEGLASRGLIRLVGQDRVKGVRHHLLEVSITAQGGWCPVVVASGEGRVLVLACSSSDLRCCGKDQGSW